MKKLWQTVKTHVWKFVGALISDTKPNGEVAVSLGRICFLAVLIFMFILWRKSLYNGIEMPPGLMEVFYTLAAYVFGSKAIDTVRDRLGCNGSGDTPEEGDN